VEDTGARVSEDPAPTVDTIVLKNENKPETKPKKQCC
jgi:hypothetical protein